MKHAMELLQVITHTPHGRGLENHRIKRSYCVAFVPMATVGFVLSSQAQTTNVLVNDTWLDGNRNQPAPPTYAENNGVIGADADADGNLESAWFNTGTGATMTPSAGHLTLGVGATSASWTTYFTPEATPVTLANVGDALRITWVFTPANVNTNNNSQNFRLAVVDSPSAARTFE